MKKQSWYTVTAEVEPNAAEFASLLFFEHGASGILEEEKEKKCYIKASFDGTRFSLSELQSFLETKLKLISCVEEYFDPQQEDWKQHFPPHEIVPGIVVIPSWEKTIKLDPGMAFGTGLHETTKLCAQALFDLSKNAGLEKFATGAVLDVGCGSGILTLIANRLGFSPLSVVEIDPVALEIAQHNFEKNNLNNVHSFSDLGSVEGTFSVIVANILLVTLLMMKEELVKYLAPGGSLILSGVTKDQVDELKAGFLSLKVINETFKGEWAALVFAKEPKGVGHFSGHGVRPESA